MKYLEYTLIFSLLGSIMLLLAYFSYYWRLKYLQNLAKTNILKRQKYREERIFYSSWIIEKCVAFLYMHPIKNRRYIIEMAAGRVSQAAIAISERNHFLGTLLLGHQNAAKSLSIMKKNKKEWLKSPKFAPFYCIIAYQCFELPTFMNSIKKINGSALKFPAKGYYDYISTYAYMQEADMLSASQSASNALKYFIKSKYVYETIKCYAALGEIYRLSCINEIANSMFEAGLQIAQKCKISHLQAQISAMLGIQRVIENRIDEARDKYEKALILSATETLKAEIYTQNALLELSENNLSVAKKHLNIAIKIFKRRHNKIGYAFALQLLGHIHMKKNQHRRAAEIFKIAANLYNSLKNYSALAECLYTEAIALNRLQKNNKSEANLRLILEMNRHHNNNFHIANVYNLLGLIFMEKGDFQRAKTLFQQSVNLEQSHSRCAGIAADYTDLALIEQLTGNQETAKNNLNIALEFAKQSEDEELINLILKRINAIS